MDDQQEALRAISDSEQQSSKLLNSLDEAELSREEIMQQIDLAMERLEDLPYASALFIIGMNANTVRMINNSLEILRSHNGQQEYH